MPESINKSKRSLAYAAINIIIALAGLFAIAIGLNFLLNKEVTNAVSSIGCGLLMILVATIDRFEVIKGIGIEAKTKSLQKDLDQADKVLAQIKDITVAFAPSLLRVSASAGRYMGPPPPELVYKLARATDKLMTAAGQSKVDVRNSLAPWSTVAARDLAWSVLRPVEKEAIKQLRHMEKILYDRHQPRLVDDPKRQQLINDIEIARTWSLIHSRFENSSPAHCAFELQRLTKEVPAFLDKQVAEIFLESAKPLIKELEYLAQHDDFQNPEVCIELISKLHQASMNPQE